MSPNFIQSLSRIGTGNILRWVIAMFGFLLSWRENFTVFWNNRRLIGSCLYSLVLARGLLLKRFPPLILTCQHKGLLQVRQGSQGCLHKRPNILLLSNLSHYSSFDFEPECHLSWSCCCCLRIRQMWTDGRQRTRGDNAIWVLNSCQMKACTTKVLS